MDIWATGLAGCGARQIATPAMMPSTAMMATTMPPMMVCCLRSLAAFSAAARSPAKGLKVARLPGETRSCRVTVPDGQLSLAIGNKGQNARLCARLTGYNIDIRPESGYYGEEEDKPEAPAPEAEAPAGADGAAE